MGRSASALKVKISLCHALLSAERSGGIATLLPLTVQTRHRQRQSKKRERKEEGQADTSCGLTEREFKQFLKSGVFDWTAREEKWSIPGWAAGYPYLPAFISRIEMKKRTLQILLEFEKFGYDPWRRLIQKSTRLLM